MKITSVSQTEEFLKFLNTSINTSDYRYKFLLPILDLAFGDGEAEVTKSTAIYEIENDWIIYIETIGQLFLYGSNNEKLLLELSNKLNFKTFQNYEIMGEYNLLYKLLKAQNIKNYSVIKDRIFYQLDKFEKLFPRLENTLPDIEEVDELTQMMLNYYHEEYNGTRDKSYETILEKIIWHINTQTIHIFKENDIIKAFCTISDPDIGIIYTKPEYRNNQIGKRLLSTCSNILLELNGICYLMTDLNNYSSNKLSLDLGYEEIYKHANIKILAFNSL